MPVFHNKISKIELKQKLRDERLARVNVSLYTYTAISNPHNLRNKLYSKLFEIRVFGRIYIANEGINLQVSVPKHAYVEFLFILSCFFDLNKTVINKTDSSNSKAFFVLKIKVRDKIVADGISDANFDMRNKGKYVDAEEFNKLTLDKNTIIVDMRNHYEYEVGHFENAIEIPSDTFREQLPMAVDMLRDKKDANIIMYCTGGIRCEKASAYMKHNGFKNVFHLEGGIIHYANHVKEKHLQNKFLGKNFVFDDRLGEKIGDEIISVCHQCGNPADNHTNCVNPGCHLLFIQCAACREKYEGCCSVNCREIIHLPEDEQLLIRKGVDKGRNIFNKSRKRMLVLREAPKPDGDA